MTTRRRMTHFRLETAALVAVLILGTIAAGPASAQTRAALVRDVDAPPLAPVTLRADFSLTAINVQQLLTTVPAGKRLVIEHVSYYSAGASTDELIFAALRTPQFGPLKLMLEINRPHVSAASGFTIQDGSQPVKVYFDAGEEVWLTVSHNTGGSRQFTVVLTGYYVTP